MSRLLLDTHAALYWWAEPARLSDAARDAIADPANAIHVSAASGWEISTKRRNGKLAFGEDPELRMPRLMTVNGFLPLGVTMAHALRAGGMPGAHKDPFDRLIAAQALIENLVVVTRDQQIAAFGCEVLW